MWNNILFTAPPLPHFIACGQDTYVPGGMHPKRKAIGVFDLLVVTRGELYIGEENEEWRVGEGHALLLRPDLHHYPTQPCKMDTHFYWIHFHTTGTWRVLSEYQACETGYRREPFKPIQHFSLQIPKFCSLENPETMYGRINALMIQEGKPQVSSRWQQQIILQEILMMLNAHHHPEHDLSFQKVAEKSAAYLRQNYNRPITYEQLGETLHFHPNYIARCMKKAFGCTPLEYLIRYRLEQAKLRLLNTDMTIAQVAEEAGFEHIPYFTRCFVKHEGVTPSVYRKRYRF
jgi:AraC-like DNA-binding protein